MCVHVDHDHDLISGLGDVPAAQSQSPLDLRSFENREQSAINYISLSYRMVRLTQTYVSTTNPVVTVRSPDWLYNYYAISLGI